MKFLSISHVYMFPVYGLTIEPFFNTGDCAKSRVMWSDATETFESPCDTFHASIQRHLCCGAKWPARFRDVPLLSSFPLLSLCLFGTAEPQPKVAVR